MSDVSPAREFGPLRPLREEELALIRKLLSRTALADKALAQLSTDLVRDMPDGGMGSIQFHKASTPPNTRKFGKQVAEGAFKDSDGVPVSVTLNLDEQGELYELDLFKGDFSPLISYPDIEDFEIIERHGALGFPPRQP
jgi:hypothetical protein